MRRDISCEAPEQGRVKGASGWGQHSAPGLDQCRHLPHPSQGCTGSPAGLLGWHRPAGDSRDRDNCHALGAWRRCGAIASGRQQIQALLLPASPRPCCARERVLEPAADKGWLMISAGLLPGQVSKHWGHTWPWAPGPSRGHPPASALLRAHSSPLLTCTHRGHACDPSEHLAHPRHPLASHRATSKGLVAPLRAPPQPPRSGTKPRGLRGPSREATVPVPRGCGDARGTISLGD